MGGSNSKVVLDEKCENCGCWLCFCAATWDDGADHARVDPVYECRKECQYSMGISLITLIVWVLLFVVCAAFKRWYMMAWFGALVATNAVMSIIIRSDVPDTPSEDLFLSCVFPTDVIVYGVIFFVVALATGFTILSVWRARRDKVTTGKYREAPAGLDEGLVDPENAND